MVAVFGGDQPEFKTSTLNNQINLSVSENNTQNNNNTEKYSVADKVTESGVIADLAESADLAVAPSAASLSTSTAILQDSPQVTVSVEKPKVLEVSSEKREIVKYTTTSEEVIQEIADKYGITAQTIKWVNGLKGDKVEAGKELRILPVDGIVYKIKSGDSIKSLSEKYQANLERLISYNKLKDGEELKEGAEIVIPGGILPEEERPDYNPRSKVFSNYVASKSRSSLESGSISSVSLSSNYNVKAGNAYAWGNCTWYAYNRRPDIGSFWGNASTWAVSARAAGYRVDQTPSVGAIAQWNAYANQYIWGYGHVAIVESVNSDGTVTVSDMNYAGKLNVVTTRTVPASSVSNYIH
jgi:CHAP domain protein